MFEPPTAYDITLVNVLAPPCSNAAAPAACAVTVLLPHCVPQHTRHTSFTQHRKMSAQAPLAPAPLLFIAAPPPTSRSDMNPFAHPLKSRPTRLLYRPPPSLHRLRHPILERPLRRPPPPPPLPPPSPASSTSHTTATASASAASSSQPSWAQLSRQARDGLANLPPPSNPSAHQLALESLVNKYPYNPFLWHALLTRLSHRFGLDHPPLPSVVEQALDRVPSGSRGILYHFQVTILIHTNRLSSALQILSRVIASDPHPNLYLALAAIQTRQRQYELARAAYSDGVKLFSTNAQLWRNWAYFESSHGSKETALHTCRQALDCDPSNPRAWRTMVQLQMAFSAGDAHLADVLHEALTQCPYDPVLRLQLARIEERRRGKRAAQAVLAPVADAQHPDVMRVLGRLFFEQGDLSRGRAYLRKAVDLDVRMQQNHEPKHSGVQQVTTDEDSSANVGEARFGSRRREPRRKKKPSRQNKAVKALHSWALMESKVGNVDEARTLLSEARSLCQTDAGIWRAIAELESRERNFDEARKAFQNALSIDPNDPRVLLAWGRTEALAGDLGKAEILISKVDKLPPNRRKMLKNIGRRVDIKNMSSLFDLRNTASMDVDLTDEESRSGLLNSGVVPGDTRRIDQSGSNGSSSTSDNDDEHTTTQMALTPQVLASALRERSVMALRDGRLDDSVRLLTRASAVDPENETVWRLLASTQLRLHGIEQLRDTYRRGLDCVAQRLKYKLLHWWGQDERMAGHISEARDLFRRATMASPEYMSGWLSWGLLEKSEGEIDVACRIFDQATRRAEQDAIRAPFVFHAWGRIEELDRGRPDAAAAVFDRGTRLAPTSGALWTAWAMLEVRRADVVRARQLFDAATRADPTHVPAWHSWALLEAQRCNFASATRFFETGHNHDPSDVAVLASWAVVEGVDLGNTARARDLFQRAVHVSSSSPHSVSETSNGAVQSSTPLALSADVDPQLAKCWREWGVLEMQAGNINQARDLLQRASYVPGEEAVAWFLLGRLEAESVGNLEAAQTMWRRVLEFDPAHTPTYLHWARMEVVQRGQLDAARVLFRKGFEVCRQQWTSVNKKTSSGSVQTDSMPSPSSSVSTEQQDSTWTNLSPERCSSMSTGRTQSRTTDTAMQMNGASNTDKEKQSQLAALLTAWARTELNAGDIEQARELVQAALAADERHCNAWDVMASLELCDSPRSRGSMSWTKRLRAALDILRKGMGTCKGLSESGVLYISASNMMLEQHQQTNKRQERQDSGGSSSRRRRGVAIRSDDDERWDIRAREVLYEGLATLPNNKAVWKALGQLEQSLNCHDRSEAVEKAEYGVFSRRSDSEQKVLDLVEGRST